MTGVQTCALPIYLRDAGLDERLGLGALEARIVERDREILGGDQRDEPRHRLLEAAIRVLDQRAQAGREVTDAGAVDEAVLRRVLSALS